MARDLSTFKDGQRAMWSAGDYPEVSRMIAPVAAELARRAGAGPGVRLLDVATGSGNLAMAAAGAGAEVTGLDLTPRLLEVAASRAAKAGLAIELVEGDAEELPFADDSFDAVASCFGVIFAPRHERAVAELLRVARPGASIALSAWTPEGLNGRASALLGSRMPPPPEGVGSPLAWGTEEHVGELFAPSGREPVFERAAITIEHASPESWLDYNEQTLGPIMLARSALESRGLYDEVRAELIGLYSAANEARDGTFLARAEYLIATVTLPGRT